MTSESYKKESDVRKIRLRKAMKLKNKAIRMQKVKMLEEKFRLGAIHQVYLFYNYRDSKISKAKNIHNP